MMTPYFNSQLFTFGIDESNDKFLRATSLESHIHINEAPKDPLSSPFLPPDKF
jgi:hypothetical protein